MHRNFKSSNILLDEEYSPHLSDCGLAALSPNPEREVSNEVAHLSMVVISKLSSLAFVVLVSWAKPGIIMLCQVSADVVGSFGYSAPEFAMSGTYTVKSDVYSFGVVMLELLTGRKPLDRYPTLSFLIW